MIYDFDDFEMNDFNNALLFQVPEDQSFRSGDYVTLENTVVSYVNISRAGVEHSGEFTCTAKNDAGEIYHSRWLRIPGPPFVRPMKNQTIVAGETMKIRCPAGGYPIHRISWERGMFITYLTFHHFQI
ncbi:hypothetical protein CEXT_205831 [Caerostris extrusa]|uniref:Ig-like domain-containing protein n=1 Tax=Caerostris extrusa TaxID=172846 RepID=A0AAV4NJG4_CAEEX|nr:hypothetical protein CEXT_205831 [Caerostris extrusa]